MFPNKTEIVVIGGGIIGSAITYCLTKYGLKVVQVEQGEFVSGASGANLGQISLVDREPPLQLQLAKESLQIYKDLSRELDKDFGYVSRGGFVVLYSESQLLAARKICSIQKQNGLRVHLLSVQEIKEQLPGLEGKNIWGGIFCEEEGGLDPLELTLAYQNKARKLGALTFSRTKVESFCMEGGRITAAQTTRGKITAKVFINAAGAWSAEVAKMAGLDIGIRYHKGTAMVTEPVSELFSGPVVGGGFLAGIFSDNDTGAMRVGLAVMQQKNGSIIIGQASEKSINYDTSTNYEAICSTAKKFLEYFPGCAKLNIIRAWAGVTPYTTDGLPVFGYSGKVSNLFTAAGFKGAFTTAPALGELSASMICKGKIAEGYCSYSPDRFYLKTKMGVW
ncbi:MAG: FAD-binding oxidoreductase [Bacillota bacterium]